jgi:malate/lactate dehydrogenase
MIFGNHSTTQYPCIKHIKVKGQPISELVDQ